MGFSSEKTGSLPPAAFHLPFLFSVVTLALPFAAKASVSGYLFRQEHGTYTPITGGTQLIGGTSWNNEVFAVPLPAPFWFDGQWYSEMHVACNGYITFGIAPGGLNYSPLSSTEGYTGAIAPFGTNLWRANTTRATYGGSRLAVRSFG